MLPRATATDKVARVTLRLFDLPNAEARALLARSDAPVYVLVNPVEYHGPHLSLRNDGLVSEGMLRDLDARLAPPGAPREPIVAADLEVGADPVRGPGSRPVPFTIVRDLVVDACEAVAALGARKVVLMTFHGAPLHAAALQAGVEALERRGVRAVVPSNALMRELTRFDVARYGGIFEPVADPADRARLARDARADFHAGFGETSLALHYAPQSVTRDLASVPPCPPVTPLLPALGAAALARKLGRPDVADDFELIARALAWQGLDPFPGYTGEPHLANAESGKRLAALIIDRYVEVVTDVFAGRAKSPPPILAWLAAATLGGRVTTPSPLVQPPPLRRTQL